MLLRRKGVLRQPFVTPNTNGDQSSFIAVKEGSEGRDGRKEVKDTKDMNEVKEVKEGRKDVKEGRM